MEPSPGQGPPGCLAGDEPGGGQGATPQRGQAGPTAVSSHLLRGATLTSHLPSLCSQPKCHLSWKPFPAPEAGQEPPLDSHVSGAVLRSPQQAADGLLPPPSRALCEGTAPGASSLCRMAWHPARVPAASAESVKKGMFSKRAGLC